MKKTHLGQGPRYSSNLPNGPEVPVLGVTFIYLDENENLTRSYAVMPAMNTNASSFVTIEYLKKIFKHRTYKRIMESKSKIYVN